MSPLRECILACDERGTRRWPSRTKTWIIGGYIVESRRRHELASRWGAVKVRLCGKQYVELKWSHFFTGRHQDPESNPLLSSDTREWREQAKWAVSELVTGSDLVPTATVVRKERASDNAFVTAETGKRLLDTETFWVGVLGQIALFLEVKRAVGRVWFDQLGRRPEESGKRASWQQLRDGEWTIEPRHQRMLQRVGKELRLMDSAKEPLVQVADFVSGVIRAAAEGDDEFLLGSLHSYFPTGLRTFTLLHSSR
jgi:hypothetical protein